MHKQHVTDWPAFFKLLFLMAFVGLCFSSDTRAAEAVTQPVFTLKSALRHTYLFNPALNASRSELKAVHERLPQAYAGWKPTVLANGSINAAHVDGSNFGGGDGSTAKDMELSLSQPLFRGGQTFAETKAAKNLIAAQTQIVKAREQDILLEAAAVYLDVFRDQALLDLSISNREVIANQLEATEIRFEVGELTKTDVSQAKARLAAAESEIIRAQGALKVSEAVFEQVIGIPPHALEKPEISFQLPATLEEAIQEAERSNPVVLSSEFTHRAAENDIDDVFGELLPEIGVFSSWNRTYDPIPGLIDEQTTKSIGISATIPLYQAGSVRSRVREAKHYANQRYLEILETRREVRKLVVSRWENLKSAAADIKARALQVEAAAVAQEGVRLEAEQGTRTVLDTLDADQELFEARTAHITAQRDEAVAQFALLSAMGVLTPVSLGFADVKLDYEDNLNAVAWKIFDTDVDMVGEEQ